MEQLHETEISRTKVKLVTFEKPEYDLIKTFQPTPQLKTLETCTTSKLLLMKNEKFLLQLKLLFHSSQGENTVQLLFYYHLPTVSLNRISVWKFKPVHHGSNEILCLVSVFSSKPTQLKKKRY